MNNAQLAVARRVMSSFPTLRVRKDGWKLTPVAQGGTQGATVTVTDTMSAITLQTALEDSCRALLNG
jgi:hypothetical protein